MNVSILLDLQKLKRRAFSAGWRHGYQRGQYDMEHKSTLPESESLYIDEHEYVGDMRDIIKITESLDGNQVGNAQAFIDDMRELCAIAKRIEERLS